MMKSPMMKGMEKMRWIVAAAALVSLTVGVAGAQPGGFRHGRGHGPGFERGEHRGMHGLGAFLSEELQLSEQQETDMRALFEAEHESRAAAREELMAARGLLAEQIRNEAFDESAIRSASAEVARLQADASVAAANLLQQARAILTPEQIELAEALRSERKERRGDRRDRQRERFQSRRDG